jgi:hypothetical protein
MTMSCSARDLEKQMVLRMRRLIRVRNVWAGKNRDSKGFTPRFHLQDDVRATSTKDVRQDFLGLMIDGMLQPARLLLVAHKTPQLIHFRKEERGPDRVAALLITFYFFSDCSQN